MATGLITVQNGALVYPSGVTYAGARETSQPNSAGQIVSGQSISVKLTGGETVTTFIPYAAIGNLQAVADAINERVTAVQAIQGVASAG